MTFLGEPVHYIAYGTPGGEFPKTCRAAVITHATPGTDTVTLLVMNPTGLFFNNGIDYSPEVSQGGTWHRPSDPCCLERP